MTGTIETVDTLVVGGGQAGIAMSEHLIGAGIDHLVLERGRIAEAWRSRRWDSLVANGPAWHDRFPTRRFEDVDPDGFAPRESVARYFETHARELDAPVRCGVEVRRVARREGASGFVAETSAGTVRARNVVAATGPFGRPVIPPLVPGGAGIHQLHSADYRNPAQLPPGGVLVVGAGSSGGQIADELNRAGRDVVLSVGPHARPPRAYRGRDYCWWLGVLGKWDAVTPDAGAEHVTISVSGARGGRTVDFRRLAAEGVTLVGRAAGFGDGAMHFAPDLAETIARGDADHLAVLDEADAYVEAQGLDLPPDPGARRLPPDPACLTEPILSLDLAARGIGTILWATGYVPDYGWLDVDVLDERGRPRHRRGISDEPGLYFLGLPWQSRRASSFIYGVWHDARFIAEQIATRRAYLDYDEARRAAEREAGRPARVA